MAAARLAIFLFAMGFDPGGVVPNTTHLSILQLAISLDLGIV